MPSKEFTLDDGLNVMVYKRKGNRSLRLRIDPGGLVKVTIPAWAPYRAGVNFAFSRKAWIRAQQPVITHISDGQAIGKAHHLQFVKVTGTPKITSRINSLIISVYHPEVLHSSDTEVQLVAQAACRRALRRQAEQLLPQRLKSLAGRYNFNYHSVKIKQLKGRWGSCDQHGDIVLNLFLMQLPWELIDYVLLHELTHTVILRHGPDFWQRLGAILPDLARHKKSIRDFQPVLLGCGIIKTS